MTIELSERGNHLRLTVCDDGAGFDLAHEGHVGDGLRNMRERAALLGATLHIASQPEGGTSVEVDLPRRAPSP